MTDTDTMRAATLDVVGYLNPLAEWPWTYDLPDPSEWSNPDFYAITPDRDTDISNPHTSTIEQHMARIASFVQTPGWQPVVTIDGLILHDWMTSTDDNGEFLPAWPITDGNHRLVAAHFLGIETVEVIPQGGAFDYIADLLDVPYWGVVGLGIAE